MSKLTPEEVAERINAEMKRTGKSAITMKWPDFYRLTGRERVTAPFLENLSEAMRKESILMAKGVAVIAFVIDYNFAPVSDADLAVMEAGALAVSGS